ncbi:hypothetical protein TWF718_011181 [Orbilia javanica]|uniref:F-box domain-containing protein n=1 Tax=Orbilia javanica TaxID=47235 RepID=A0AAN8MNF9_9PEZI
MNPEGHTTSSWVLNTNELLEAILKHIPPQELLISTRSVSKNWKALIETSPKLQWKTWQWKGTNIPPSVLEDTDKSLFSRNGRKYGYEFAEDAVYWLRKFWCMALAAPRHSDGEDGLPSGMCEWMIKQLPDMELFRPRLESEGIRITFELNWRIHGISLAIETLGGTEAGLDGRESETGVVNEGFTLRDLARIIYEKALSSQGMGVFQYVWNKTGNGRWVRKVQRKFNFLVFISARAPIPRELRNPEATVDETKYLIISTFVFDLQNLDLSSNRGLDVRIEYWPPGKLQPEAREEPLIFPGVIEAPAKYSDEDTDITDDEDG